MKREIIENYLAAYNQMDVEAMVKDLHDAVTFRNFSNGQLTLELTGKEAFRQQAEKAKTLFLEREQVITSWQETDDQVRISLIYRAILAADFSSELKKGHELNLTGESVFTFKDGQIISLEDLS